MEVMVSVTIFTIIVVIGMGSLITIFKTLQKTRADRQTIDSVSFVLDTMTRRIRTGKQYESSDLGSGIKFIDQDNIRVSFFSGLDSNNIPRLYMTDEAFGPDNEAGPFDITPENFELTSFSVDILGNSSRDDGIQPMAVVHLVGLVKNGQQQSRLAVQTLISQRLLDFPVAVDFAPDTGSSGFKKSTSTSMTTRTLRLPLTEFVSGTGSPAVTTDLVTAPATIDTTTTTTSTIKALNQPRTVQ